MYARTRRAATVASLVTARLGRCDPSPSASSTRCPARPPDRSSPGSGRPGRGSPNGTGSASPPRARPTSGSSAGRSTIHRSAGGSGSSSAPSGRTGWSSSAPVRSRSRPGATGATSSMPRGPGTGGRSRTTASRPTSIAIAVGDRGAGGLPDDLGDNALPRWLAEVRGWSVDDLRRRWRLGIDIDGPLDLVLTADEIELASERAEAVDTSRVRDRIDAIRAVTADRHARAADRRSDIGANARLVRAAHRLADPRARRGARPAHAHRGSATGGLGPRRAAGARRAGLARGRTWRRSPTAPSSTAGSSSRTDSARTSAPGRGPRTASPPTCCSPTRSSTRGCAT